MREGGREGGKVGGRGGGKERGEHIIFTYIKEMTDRELHYRSSKVSCG